MSDDQVPRVLHLTAQMDLAAGATDAGTDGGPTLPRFNMVAYTGGAMRIAGWRYPVIVDLAGLSIPSQLRPIRFGHDASSGVGHTDSIAVAEGKLVAAGVVSRDTAAAREIVASARNGFPWQASLGAAVEQFEFVREDQAVHVNGREFKGPVNVVRRATLGEISFVDLAADGNTSASVAASGFANRRFRKAQHSVYSVRTAQHIRQRIALDMVRDQRAPNRFAAIQTLHLARIGTG